MVSDTISTSPSYSSQTHQRIENAPSGKKIVETRLIKKAFLNEIFSIVFQKNKQLLYTHLYYGRTRSYIFIRNSNSELRRLSYFIRRLCAKNYFEVSRHIFMNVWTANADFSWLAVKQDQRKNRQKYQNPSSYRKTKANTVFHRNVFTNVDSNLSDLKGLYKKQDKHHNLLNLVYIRNSLPWKKEITHCCKIV